MAEVPVRFHPSFGSDEARDGGAADPWPQIDATTARRLRLFSRGMAVAVIAAAALALIGWAFDLQLLTTLRHGWPSMKANTAAGLVIAGIGLWFATGTGLQPSLRRFMVSGGIALALLGALTLGQDVGGWDLRIDEALFRDTAGPTLTGPPGRMAPATALCFILYGLALVLAGRRQARLASVVAVVVALVSAVALLGYLYRVETPYGLQAPYASVSLQTALAWMALSLGMCTAHPDFGLVAVLASARSGGVMARRLLPAAVVGPVLLGWLRLEGERASLFGAPFGESLLVISTVTLLFMVTALTATGLNRLDAQREEAIASLEHREAHQHSILDAALDGVVSIDEAGLITYWNPQAERIFGWSSKEAVGQELAELVMPEEFKARHRRGLERFLATGEGAILDRAVEVTGLRRDGSTVPVEIRVRALREGGSWWFNAFVADLTDRKRGEAALLASQQRVNRLLESNIIGILFTDRGGRVVEANDAFLQMVGYTRDDVVSGQVRWNLMTPPAYWDANARATEQLESSGVAVAREQEFIRKDGNCVSVLVGAARLDAATGDSIAFVLDLTELRRAQGEHRRSEARYRRFFEEDLAGAYITTPDGRLLECNLAFARILGFGSPQEAQARGIASLYPDAEVRRAMLQRLEAEGKISDEEVVLQRVDGSRVHAIETVVGSFDAGGGLTEITGYVFDVSERRKAEDQLRQAQKMDAIGQLAGGVAHDFNNLLGVITGYAGLLAKALPPEDKAKSHVAAIQSAADRAASLTRQLLAFSRKQILQQKVVDLNEIVAGMESLIGRLIGEDIELVKVRASRAAFVRADPSQLEQILLNLAVNARDAMPHGGSLTIETELVDLDAAYVQAHRAARPGRYAMLAVSDTGVGMDAEVQARIFEPFFTTKEPGTGTGLGLSTVYGIVKQSGGYVWLYSEQGRGATFKVYLPRVEEGSDPAGAPLAPAPAPRGSETVLLVEDEAMLRELIEESLATNGYRVLSAKHGADALGIAERHEGPIHLLLTDAIMPGMSGRELATHVAEIRGGIKILYMSGYTDDAVVRHGVLAAEVAFLQKPFTPDALARKVRNVLDDRPSGPHEQGGL